MSLANGYVDRYAPSGTTVTNSDYTSALSGVDSSGENCNIAVDGEESVYVDTFRDGPVVKYEASQFSPGVGAPAVGELIDSLGSTLAADPAVSSHVLYVDEGNAIEEYESSGELKRVGVFGESEPGVVSGSFGVAVNGAPGGDLYASSGSGRIDIYNAMGIVVPDVVTGTPALDVTTSSATLSGTVNPDETEVTSCQFEYGTEAGVYPHVIPCSHEKPLTGNAPVEVTANLSGLKATTLYYYRLVAANGNGGNSGSPHTLTTSPNRPAVLSESATLIFPNEAVLGAVVVPEEANTTYHFVYGPTTAYGSSVPLGDVELGTGAQAVRALLSVTGLQPSTTYHYAVVATNAGGTTVGSDRTFTTAPAPVPLVETGAASNVSQGSASVSATIDPRGVQTSYELDVGTDTNYGARVFGDAGSGSSPETVTVLLQGLAPGATYHYRWVATNSFGTSYGADQTFTTPIFEGSALAAPPVPALIPVPTTAFPLETGTAGKPSVKKQAKAKRKKGRTRKRQANRRGQR